MGTPAKILRSPEACLAAGFVRTSEDLKLPQRGAVGRTHGLRWSLFSLRSTIHAPRSSEASPRPIARPRLDAIFFADVRSDFDGDLAEAFVRVGSGIVRHRVRVAKVFTDGFEGLYLLLPGSGEVSLASGAQGEPAEHIA